MTTKKNNRKKGLTKTVLSVFQVPLSPWPKDKRLKELGQYMNLLMAEAMQAYSLALFTRVLGWQPEEVEILLAQARKDLNNWNYHLYTRLYVDPVPSPSLPPKGCERIRLTRQVQACGLREEATVAGTRGRRLDIYDYDF